MPVALVPLALAPVVAFAVPLAVFAAGEAVFVGCAAAFVVAAGPLCQYAGKKWSTRDWVYLCLDYLLVSLGGLRSLGVMVAMAMLM